jgi:hypothetical protein
VCGYSGNGLGVDGLMPRAHSSVRFLYSHVHRSIFSQGKLRILLRRATRCNEILPEDS